MKTMSAKFPGTCRACGEPIHPGDIIDFFGRGRAQHHDCNHPNATLEPGSLANDRRLANDGLYVIRFSSGHVVTQNSKGRCEDAPCCGCCS